MKKCKICGCVNTGLGAKHWHCSPFVVGYAEVDDDKKPVMGRLGMKVHKHKKGLINEGFRKNQIAKVRVAII